MEIFGREYNFLLCVGAEEEIAHLCRDGSIRNLAELMSGESAIAGAKQTACILSRWYEKRRAFEDPGYEPAPLTEEMLDLLPFSGFTTLQKEIVAACTRDMRQSVEVGETKKNGAVKSN